MTDTPLCLRYQDPLQANIALTCNAIFRNASVRIATVQQWHHFFARKASRYEENETDKTHKIGETRRKTQTNQEGIDHAKNCLSDRAHLVLVGMLDLEAIDDPLADVASRFQHSHMLVMGDGRCDHL